MDFFPEVDLGHDAAEAIARGLYAVAKCDGLHEREAGLIASFWIDAGGSGSLSDLERGAAITPAELAAALHTQPERLMFVKTALLLAWADGSVSAAEPLSVDQAAVDKLEASVKDFLLQQLAHLANTDATTAVAKKLKV